jgi:LysM repeat protein
MRRQMLVFLVLIALLWPVAVQAAPSAEGTAQSQTVHVVQPGENLFRISLRYGTTVDAIMAANGLTSPDMVYVGQSLRIPGEGAPASSNSSSSTNSPSSNTVGTLPAGGTHTVGWGDTLTNIARRYGVSVDALVRANQLSSPHTIYRGQQLLIPGAGSTAAGGSGLGTLQGAAYDARETYTVQPGDTLTKIAQRFRTTAAQLAWLNGVANPGTIYVGQVLRLSSAVPPAPPGSDKRIIMDLSEQHLYAYQGEQLVFSFVASSGVAPTYTAAGEFRVQSKILNAYGSTWNIWMPYWLGIYWAGSTENGIHALPILPNGQTLWAGYLGSPVSYGCIVLDTNDARLLYEWAEMGTPVTVRY